MNNWRIRADDGHVLWTFPNRHIARVVFRALYGIGENITMERYFPEIGWQPCKTTKVEYETDRVIRDLETLLERKTDEKK